MEKLKKVELDENNITKEDLEKIASLQWGKRIFDEKELKGDFELKKGYSEDEVSTGKALGEKLIDMALERGTCYYYSFIEEISNELGYDEYNSIKSQVKKYLKNSILSYDEWYESGPKSVEDITRKLSSYIDSKLYELNDELEDVLDYSDKLRYNYIDEIDDNDIYYRMRKCEETIEDYEKEIQKLKEEAEKDPEILEKFEDYASGYVENIEFYKEKEEKLEEILELYKPLTVFRDSFNFDGLIVDEDWDPRKTYEYRYEESEEVDFKLDSKASDIAYNIIASKKETLGNNDLQLYPDEVREIIKTKAYKDLSPAAKEDIDAYLGLSLKNMHSGVAKVKK